MGGRACRVVISENTFRYNILLTTALAGSIKNRKL